MSKTRLTAEELNSIESAITLADHLGEDIGTGGAIRLLLALRAAYEQLDDLAGHIDQARDQHAREGKYLDMAQGRIDRG